MSTKTMIWIGVMVGSTIGSLVPTWLGAGLFSIWSILGSGAGGLLGIWAGFKISNL